MIVTVTRQQDVILIHGPNGHAPIELEHDEAVDIAQLILDMVGHMKQEREESE